MYYENYDPVKCQRLLNDFGGGNIGWWQDYLRSEIDCSNHFHLVRFRKLKAENAALRQKLEALVESAKNADKELHKYPGVSVALEPEAKLIRRVVKILQAAIEAAKAEK